jgi:hypothetical protein
VIGQRQRPTLGVGLSRDTVRGVLLERGRIAWTGECPIEGESLRPALGELVAQAARARPMRAAVVVAVGPTFAQLRHLHGLPAVRDTHTLAAVVQQSAGRYFRQNGIPMITTPVAERTAGAAWVGAVEAPVVEAIAEVCREHRLTVVSLVPTGALLGYSAPDGSLTWHDGDVALQLRYERGRIVECRCVPAHLAHAHHGEGAELPEVLRGLGDEALRFADAYGAARGGAASPFALRPAGEATEPSVRRVAVAAMVCAVAVAFAVLAPVLAATRVEREAAARVASASLVAAGARRTEQTLADSARLLSRLAAFQRDAGSKTLLLAALTCAIEEPTMLASLRFEPSGGMLTALTPSAAELLAMLEAVPEIVAPVIVGSVTPESPTPAAPSAAIGAPSMRPSDATAERPLERVTVRFQWRRDAHAALPSPQCAE